MTQVHMDQRKMHQRQRCAPPVEGGQHFHRRTTTTSMVKRRRTSTRHQEQSNFYCSSSRWFLFMTVLLCGLSSSPHGTVQSMPNFLWTKEAAENKSATKIRSNQNKKNSGAVVVEQNEPPLAMQVFEEILQAPIQFDNEEEEALTKVCTYNAFLVHFSNTNATNVCSNLSCSVCLLLCILETGRSTYR